MSSLTAALLVLLGGAVGAPLRYVTDLVVSSLHDTVFPWGTWVVNVTGSLVLGIVGGLVAGGAPPWLATLAGHRDLRGADDLLVVRVRGRATGGGGGGRGRGAERRGEPGGRPAAVRGGLRARNRHGLTVRTGSPQELVEGGVEGAGELLGVGHEPASTATPIRTVPA